MSCTTRTKGAFTIEACFEGVDGVVEARIGQEIVGALSVTVDTRSKHIIVGGVDVSEGKRRTGVGTALYEALLDVGCRMGFPIASDEMRSPYAEAFWRKQQAKGRARCNPGEGAVYIGPVRKLSKEERARLPMPPGGYQDSWDCANYVIEEPCKVPTLEGTRRSPRRRPRRRR